jgi:hypothetical protein
MTIPEHNEIDSDKNNQSPTEDASMSDADTPSSQNLADVQDRSASTEPDGAAAIREDPSSIGSTTASPESLIDASKSESAAATTSVEQSDKGAKKKGVRLTPVLVIIAVVGLLASGVWFWLEPGFEPFTVALVSLAALLEFFALSQGRYKFALISFVVAAIAVGGAYLWYEVLFGAPVETRIAFRVADDSDQALARSEIFLFYGGNTPIKQTTDVNGIATFNADSSYDEARIVVEARGYQVHQENINLSRNRDMSVNLRPLDENVRAVVVRVVNQENLSPVPGAEVLLIAGGETFSDLTDDNGLTRFEIEFSGELLNADLTVQTEADNTANLGVSLRPDQLQEVRITARDESAQIGRPHAVTEDDVREIIGVPSGFNPPEPLSNLVLFSDMSFETEQEPNDALENAQQLRIIGADHPVSAEINAFEDVDYFVFEAVAGQTYAVELFNLDSNLGLSTNYYRCFGSSNDYKGLRLAVYDPGENVIASQCSQNRGGNTFSGLSFQAKVDGRHVIEVVPHSNQVEGSYNLLVSTKYDEEGATWDQISLEPNNIAANAFPILPGYQNALTSFIEPQESGLIAERADNDWYQLNAVAGRTYVVEIFDVGHLIGLGSTYWRCYGSSTDYRGLGVAIFAPNLDGVTSTCQPNGASNVHTIATFTAQVNGSYYIQVFPHVATEADFYSIRVLPKHDEPGTARDNATLEPNNRLPNAAEISLDSEAPLTSAFEERLAAYHTNRPDQDWFVFRAEAGSIYVVEVSNIEDTLLIGSRYYRCFGSTSTYQGVAVAVYDAAAEGVTSRCSPNGEGNIHTSVEFEALVNSNYYIQVFPHFENGYGEYDIRVTRKQDN